MFHDVPALFTTDGVTIDALRAGEPRLRRSRGRSTEPVAATSRVRVRQPLLRRSARVLTP